MSHKPPSTRARTAGQVRYRWLATAALTVLSVEVSAQSVDYGALEQLFGEPVTTSATGSPQRAAQVPANMEIITRDDIRRSGADNIPDILRRVAGVDVRRYGFAQADVSVRGYDQPYSPRLLVLVNGRQVYLDDYGYTAWQTLPVQLDEIRQIEVVKGPSSALFGFNAMGGVVNIITYDPLSDATNVVTLRGGTQDNLSGSAVATLPVSDNASLRVSLGGSRAKEFSTASLPPGLGPYYDSPYDTALNVDGRIKLTPRVELTAEASVTEARNFEAQPVPTFSDDTHRTYSLKLGMVADTACGLLGATAYRNDLQFFLASPAVDFGIRDDVYVVQVSDLLKVGPQHTLRLGLEYRNNSASGPVFGGKIGYEVYAVSTMWNWQLTPELALTHSVRFDELALNFAGRLTPGDQYTVADYEHASLGEPTFNSGLVYTPTTLDTVRLLVARGVQAPSLVDFGTQGGTNSNVPIEFIGSPALDAASLMNYEVDYDRTLPGIQSKVRAAIFYQKTRNLITSALNAPFSPGAGGLVSYAQNFGSSAARGGELGLAGADASGWRWNLSDAYISIAEDATLPLQGNSGPLDYVHGTPANVLNAGVGYSRSRFEFDVQGRWQSRFTDYRQDSSSRVGVAPFQVGRYITLNARAGYHVTDHLTVALVGAQLMRARVFQAAGAPVERRVLATLTANF